MTIRNGPLPKQLGQTYKCSHSHVLLRFTHNVQWSVTGAILDMGELKFFPLAGPGFFSLRLDHNFVSSNWAKPSRVKFKGLLIFRAVISIISIVIYVLICPTYYVDTWVSHSTCKPLLKPLLNEAFILVLMMKSLLFWSMKILKVLCENWAYNLNIKWAYPI